jgi:Tol biopolymer transport system component
MGKYTMRALSWVNASVFFGLVVVLSACGGGARATVEPVSGILFTSERDGNQEIYLIQPDGGGLVRLTKDPAVDTDPDWSPDGRRIVFRSRRDGSSDIFVMGADGSQPTNLVRDPSDSLDDEFAPAWNPDGETLALYTDRFQPPMGSCRSGWGLHHLALMPATGGKEHIHHFDAWPGEQETFDWSPDGRYLAFSSACADPVRHLYRWDRETEQVEQLTDGPSNDTYPAWSHDGRYLAFTSKVEDNVDVYLLALEGGALTRLTTHPAKDAHPTWSPDDAHIAFTSNRDGNEEIYVLDVADALQGAANSDPRNLTQNPARDFRPAWSPTLAPHCGYSAGVSSP